MDNHLSFSIDRHDGGHGVEGRFVMGRALSDADGKISHGTDLWHGGSISTDQLFKKMNALLARFPDLIDAHVTIAACGFEIDPKWAMEHYQRAFAIGMAAIPAGFIGAIRYDDHANRPFLRAVHGLALAYRALGDHQKAVNMLERSLGWNPDDNLGCRFLLAEYAQRADVTVTFDLGVYDREAMSWPIPGRRGSKEGEWPFMPAP